MCASTSRLMFCASKLVTLQVKRCPGFTQNASTTLVSMPPRVMVAVYGSVAPSRFTLTFTCVPLGPRSSSATSGESILRRVLAVHGDDHVAAPHARRSRRAS